MLCIHYARPACLCNRYLPLVVHPLAYDITPLTPTHDGHLHVQVDPTLPQLERPDEFEGPWGQSAGAWRVFLAQAQKFFIFYNVNTLLFNYMNTLNHLRGLPFAPYCLSIIMVVMDRLNELADELRGMPEPDAQAEGWVRAPGQVIKQVRYTHDAVIDEIIRNPSISQNSLASLFGYTPGWISQVMSSDAFKNKLELRKEELVDPQIRLTLNERFNALVGRSLDVLQEKLMLPNADPELALRAAALGAKALGLGGNAQPVVSVHNSSDRLEKLADRLTGLLGQKRAELIVDVSAHVVSQGVQDV